MYLFSRQLQSNNYNVAKLSTSIPVNLPPTHFSLDSVKFVHTPITNKTHLFVRSQSNHSELYYSYRDWEKGMWSTFVPIGGSKHYLAYDFDVVVNTFVWVSNTHPNQYCKLDSDPSKIKFVCI